MTTDPFFMRVLSLHGNIVYIFSSRLSLSLSIHQALSWRSGLQQRHHYVHEPAQGRFWVYDITLAL